MVAHTPYVLVDAEALFETLESGVLAGAALDVFDVEPLPLGHRLVSMDTAVLTPHISSATVETREQMAELAAENVVAFSRRGSLYMWYSLKDGVGETHYTRAHTRRGRQGALSPPFWTNSARRRFS